MVCRDAVAGSWGNAVVLHKNGVFPLSCHSYWSVHNSWAADALSLLSFAEGGGINESVRYSRGLCVIAYRGYIKGKVVLAFFVVVVVVFLNTLLW